MLDDTGREVVADVVVEEDDVVVISVLVSDEIVVELEVSTGGREVDGVGVGVGVFSTGGLVEVVVGGGGGGSVVVSGGGAVVSGGGRTVGVLVIVTSCVVSVTAVDVIVIPVPLSCLFAN